MDQITLYFTLWAVIATLAVWAFGGALLDWWRDRRYWSDRRRQLQALKEQNRAR